MIGLMRWGTLALAAVVLMGCGGGGGTPASGGKKKVMIGIVAKSQTNPVFQAAHAGARDAAKELGPAYNAEVEINIQTPSKENPTEQADAVEALTRLGANGIAISCSDGKMLEKSINKAVAAGVVVVCFDSDSPGSKRMCYYGTDDAVCGQEVMNALAKAMGEKGTVAIMAGNPSAPNLQARTAGVRETMKKYPGMRELASRAVYHEETPEKAAEKLQEVQRANPEIQGWAMIGGWPLFTENALKWQPGEVKVVAVDALPAQLPYVKKGYVEVLLAQDCYGWGHKSVEILLEKIVKGKAPEKDRVIDPLTRVTKDNADEYGKKWDKWLAK